MRTLLPSYYPLELSSQALVPNLNLLTMRILLLLLLVLCGVCQRVPSFLCLCSTCLYTMKIPHNSKHMASDCRLFSEVTGILHWDFPPCSELCLLALDCQCNRCVCCLLSVNTLYPFNQSSFASSTLVTLTSTSSTVSGKPLHEILPLLSSSSHLSFTSHLSSINHLSCLLQFPVVPCLFSHPTPHNFSR